MKKKIFLSVSILLNIIIIIFVLLKINLSDDDPFNHVYINEVMPANKKTIKDVNGKYSDWIEIYNDSDTVVNLADYYLTDNENNLVKWKFTKNVKVPSKGFLLVWATGENKIFPNNEIHTNFNISSDGESIILVARDGKTIIDSLKTTRIGADVSFGRLPDGTSTWKTFTSSATTPGQSNMHSNDLTQTPTFSHLGGFYKNDFRLSLNSDPETTIYYTLDGSIPTKDSLVYQEDILIKSKKGDGNQLSKLPTSLTHWYGPPNEEVFMGTVVRAIAVKNEISSDIVTHTYFIDEEIDDKYQLPVISISTDTKNLFDDETGLFANDNYFNRGSDWEREGNIEFFDKTKQLGFSQKIGIRIHGNSSRAYPIKSLRIYSRGYKGYFNYQLFPDKSIDEFNSFILRNGGSNWANVPFRDSLSQSIIKDVGNLDIQYSQPSIVFINGEYWGIHNIRDRFDDDYIYNHYGTREIDMISDINKVEYGSYDDYDRLLQFLLKDLNSKINYEYVKKLIDIKNFADLHITHIFSMNIDQPSRNVKVWKTVEAFETGYEQTDGRWRWMLYDTDQGYLFGDFSNYDRNGLIFSTNLDYHGAPTVNPKSTWPSWSGNRPEATFPLRAMLKSDEFRIYFINRFADLLNTAFQSELIIEKTETMKQLYLPYMEEHINRWKRPVSIEVWENNIDKIKLFAKERPAYMRQHIIDYFGLSGDYDLTVMDDSSSGTIEVNTLNINEEMFKNKQAFSWTGTYFKDVPVKITAKAKEGKQFVHWVSNNEKINGANELTLTVMLDGDTTISAIYEDSNNISTSVPVFTIPNTLNNKYKLVNQWY